MDTAFTPEQDDIRRTVRELLAKRCGPDEVKAATRTASGYDEDLWAALAGTLGLPGLAVPEEYGGTGCGTVELALACEESGRALLPSPLLGTAVLCAPLLQRLGAPEQRASLLPELASGALTAALAVPATAGADSAPLTHALGLTEVGGGEAGSTTGGIQARQVDGAWRLFGEAPHVLGGHTAGLLLLTAHTGGHNRSRTLLFAVRTGEGAEEAAGLTRTRVTSLDETRPAARVELRDVQAELIGEDDPGALREALAETGARAAALLAAEAAGAADGALERTLEHARTREQFGRPIGSFQALQHRLAEVYVRVQTARSAAYYAAWDPAGGGALALAQALEAQRLAAGEAVQLHGGTGFTWEHDAHLYFKRAAGDDLLFGPPHRLRERAAARAGLFEGGGAR
ncbi:acyl-CoA dehydrogenase family protein [Streptomyces sp. ODS28]|uniref:acyl-CoA dehydrogenase family protein n=1 Tax=Streptomyces sp. ODS28 TaxID=3136688 RepID=UPI0031E5622E